ncbi:MAG: hypothetical protein AB7F86_10205 [Bdellovibrionales bacterium]
MRHVTALAIGLFLAPQAWTADLPYSSSYQCLYSLAKQFNELELPLTYSADGFIVFDQTRSDGKKGVYLFAPNSAYFAPVEEMAKSASDEKKELLKISVRLAGAKSEEPVKFFFEPGAAKPRDRFRFSVANEFDRVINLDPEPADQISHLFRMKLGKTIGLISQMNFSSRTRDNPELKTAWRQTIQGCADAPVDFPLPLEAGLETTFQLQIKKIVHHLKPSFFSLEFWQELGQKHFPKWVSSRL